MNEKKKLVVTLLIVSQVLVGCISNPPPVLESPELKAITIEQDHSAMLRTTHNFVVLENTTATITLERTPLRTAIGDDAQSACGVLSFRMLDASGALLYDAGGSWSTNAGRLAYARWGDQYTSLNGSGSDEHINPYVPSMTIHNLSLPAGAFVAVDVAMITFGQPDLALSAMAAPDDLGALAPVSIDRAPFTCGAHLSDFEGQHATVGLPIAARAIVEAKHDFAINTTFDAEVNVVPRPYGQVFRPNMGVCGVELWLGEERIGADSGVMEMCRIEANNVPAQGNQTLSVLVRDTAGWSILVDYFVTQRR